MSFIKMEDPNPGRCQNFRTVNHSDGYIENLRCLDYEDVPHECSFPEPTHVVSTVNNIFRSSDLPKSEPWVKPDDSPPRKDWFKGD